MILSYSYYKFPQRKGITFFHQKTWTSESKEITDHIFDRFFDTIKNITHDEDATRIQSEDDLGDPEIQLIESAKMRTLRSLPQNSLYWGSEMYFVHVVRGHMYLKLPKWMLIFKSQEKDFFSLDPNETWLKTEALSQSTLFLSFKTLPSKPFRMTSSFRDYFRLANIFSCPQTEYLPLLTLNLDERMND